MNQHTTLTLHGSPVRTVFDLLGRDENDMTASLGWALRSSRPFVHEFVRAATGTKCRGDAVVRLQEFGDDGGFTDLELEVQGAAHLIVEAKRDFSLPTERQLRRYRPRFDRPDARGLERRLVVVSGTSGDIARRSLPRAVSGVPVAFVPWRQVHAIAARARRVGGHVERRWVAAFAEYLEELVGMDRQNSNWTYVVSIGPDTWEGWSITQREIIEGGHYFHPVARRWPHSPPNYLAFRWDGRLQSIHHVEDVTITKNFRAFIRGAARRDERVPHFLYTLGPAIRQERVVPTGVGIRRSARVWCYLDTLLTERTITDALRATKKREAKAAKAAKQT